MKLLKFALALGLAGFLAACAGPSPNGGEFTPNKPASLQAPSVGPMFITQHPEDGVQKQHRWVDVGQGVQGRTHGETQQLKINALMALVRQKPQYQKFGYWCVDDGMQRTDAQVRGSVKARQGMGFTPLAGAQAAINFARSIASQEGHGKCFILWRTDEGHKASPKGGSSLATMMGWPTDIECLRPFIIISQKKPMVISQNDGGNDSSPSPQPPVAPGHVDPADPGAVVKQPLPAIWLPLQQPVKQAI